MDRKKVVLVARDAAPSGAFIKLEPVLRESDFDVCLLVGDGKPLTKTGDEIAAEVMNGSVVVIGMSSSVDLAQPEMLAGYLAKNYGIPYGFYGDVRRCWARARAGAWFENYASNAAFYFGITQADADAAHEVFPNALLYGTGNPLREEMAFARFTREEVRAKLNIGSEEKLVLAPGGKLAAGNMAKWVVIMDALALLNKSGHNASGSSFQLILSTHPGDRTPYAVDGGTLDKLKIVYEGENGDMPVIDISGLKELKLYEELVALSPVPTRIVGKDMLTTSDMVPGSDIIVEFGSSIGIEGAYQNVPVITLGFEILLRRQEQISGSRILEAVEDGLSEYVEMANAEELAYQISKLLTPDGFARMSARQKELCPRPLERGAALRNMAHAIETIIA